ncbi:MAG TPA: DnaJ domain-containing protein [Candidatus Nitrosotalea sp.]|nr:DnaJ domain-containing protein [Candidatus Nitrosotalea sp.]
MNTVDCHQILGVQEGASQKEIKNAYRQLSLKYHPDRNKDDINGEKFKKVTEAYQQLRSEEKKKEKISESEVATKYSDFWKKYDKTANEEFHFGANFAEFRRNFGAKDTPDYEHNQEKEGSPMFTHLVLYGGLGAMALWIILSTILK